MVEPVTVQMRAPPRVLLGWQCIILSYSFYGRAHGVGIQDRQTKAASNATVCHAPCESALRQCNRYSRSHMVQSTVPSKHTARKGRPTELRRAEQPPAHETR